MSFYFTVPTWRNLRYGVVIATEALLAFSGARIHSNNTAGMIAMIEALSFLGLRGLVARDVDSFL